jgi:hypothetical protein
MHTAPDTSSPAASPLQRNSSQEGGGIVWLFKRQTSASDAPCSFFSARSPGFVPSEAAPATPAGHSVGLLEASSARATDDVGRCSGPVLNVASHQPAASRSADAAGPWPQPSAAAARLQHPTPISRQPSAEDAFEDVQDSRSPSSITLSCPHSTNKGRCRSTAQHSNDKTHSAGSCRATECSSVDKAKSLNCSGALTIPSDSSESLLPLPPPMEAHGWFALDAQKDELIASPLAVKTSHELALRDASPRSFGPETC